jgi:hypothetical protein
MIFLAIDHCRIGNILFNINYIDDDDDDDNDDDDDDNSNICINVSLRTI